MDIKHLFTSFEGRTPRMGFWIGIIGIIIISFALIFILGSILPASLASVIGTLIVMYPAAAIYTKRLHDRNKPMTPWLWIFIVPGILYSAMSAFGIGFETIEMAGQPPVSIPSGFLGYVMTLAVTVVGIWALVELGFLRGTNGDNDYGPDQTT